MDEIKELETRIQALQQRLQAVHREREVEMERRRKATPLRWNFHLRLVHDDAFGMSAEEIYDSSVTRWRLAGQVVNRDEALAAGHDSRLNGGTLDFLFNGQSGRIICCTGSTKTFFIIGLGWNATPEQEQQAAATIASLGKAINNAFIERKVGRTGDGIDVTDIIVAQPGFEAGWCRG